jgi:O-6-methylguanine DNA methyltransferase
LDVGPVDGSGNGTNTRFWLAWNDRGLVRTAWSTDEATLQGVFGSALPQRELPAIYAQPLRRYFEGEDVDPTSLPVDLTGTEFQKRVWNALRTIPRGHVRSYGGVAAEIRSPRAMRAVGAANASNPLPLVVPCHRVVETGMGMGGYSGGLPIKRYLLGLEGVVVVGDRVQPGQGLLDLAV